MLCPFLSLLPSQFAKNYSQKLLKTFGGHCPVLSQGGSCSLTTSATLGKDCQQDKDDKESSVQPFIALRDVMEDKSKQELILFNNCCLI